MKRLLAIAILVAFLLSSCTSLPIAKVWVCSECGRAWGSMVDAGMCHGVKVNVEYWQQ